MNARVEKEVNLLVVEDDTFNRMLIVAMLAKHKTIRVVEAKDGREALKILKNLRIDIVLLDLYIPEIDGFEILKEVRGSERLKEIPIMVISSDETEEKKSLKMGANAFVQKPIKLKSLEAKIDTILGSK